MPNSLTNVNLLHNHVEKLIKTMAVSMYWKDKVGSYLGANQEFLNASGLNSFDDVIGKSDLDLVWHKEAPIMMKNDKEIIRRDLNQVYTEWARSPMGGLVQYFSHKTPLYSSNGKIIGTVGISFTVDTFLNVPSILANSPCVDDKIKEDFILSNASIPGLSRRQTQCLYFLVKGLTIKAIALKLSLSPKTIEHYIEMIKEKLNCHTRMELIAKAIKIKIIRDCL